MKKRNKIIYGLVIIVLLSVIVKTIKEIPPNNNSLDKIAHVSFDDVYEVLIDITEKANYYDSVFENSFLGALKAMHDEYNAKFTLYVYERVPVKGYDISEVTRKFRQELSDNSDWLRFGYHSIEPTTSFNAGVNLDEFITSFNKVNAMIRCFAGENAVSSILRLNYFQGSPEIIRYLKDNGVTGLLCADDDRISYDLTKEQYSELKGNEFIEKDGMFYYNTDFRFDGKKFTTYEMLKLRNQEVLVVFMHEWALGGRGLDKLKMGIAWLYKNGYRFSLLH